MANPTAPGKNLANYISNTPIVQLSKLVNKEMADVFIKLEGQNPAGSIKDRTAMGLILDAEEKGILSPGSGQTIIEPTSGNTGIGLAFLAAMRGYKCIIVLPDSMSEERKETLLTYAKQEGIFIGMSSGAAAWAAIEVDRSSQKPGSGQTSAYPCCTIGSKVYIHRVI